MSVTTAAETASRGRLTMAGDEVVRIAVVGDYQPDHETHPATTSAIVHGARRLGLQAKVDWVATDAIDPGASRLDDYDGVWIAPGSPYRSLGGALQAITTARTADIPVLGTCAGFQHMVLEYARNVVGAVTARHAEYDPDADDLFVTPLSCSLAGQSFTVQLREDSRARSAYGVSTATERYYCNFGLNPDRRADLEAAGLVVTGTDTDGEARIVELPSRRFFLATLFVPQVSSTADRPHPLVLAFVEAAKPAPTEAFDRVDNRRLPSLPDAKQP